MIKLERRKLVLSFIDFSTRLKQITSLKELLPPGVHIAKAALENGVPHPGTGGGGGGFRGFGCITIKFTQFPHKTL